MPVLPTYPGVYIEEIPSGVRTITGVATSITAFIGRALKGPTNEPVTINNFGDFAKIFGGLWKESYLGFSVRDFFLNGGSQAIIVRLYHPATREEANSLGTNTTVEIPSKLKISVGDLTFEAVSEGNWGVYLGVEVDRDVSEEVATEYGLTTDDLFNLTVRLYSPTGLQSLQEERFLNLSLRNSPKRVDEVLTRESELLRWDNGNGNEHNLDTLNRGAPDDLQSRIPGVRTFCSLTQASNDKNIGSKNAEVTTRKSSVSDGLALTSADFIGDGNTATTKKGLYALMKADIFNLLYIPPFPYLNYTNEIANLVDAAATFCEDNRAFLILDPPTNWNSVDSAYKGMRGTNGGIEVGTKSKNAAVFFPWLKQPNPLKNNLIEDFPPGGAVAGVFARTDENRGVWKAPAGTEATLIGVVGLSIPLTDAENGRLNPWGLNCLRSFPIYKRIVWGARTLEGADQLASEWKYIPVRRLTLFIEESLYRATKWVVFEPNDEPLWASIRMNVGAFMNNLFKQGAFQGKTPREAYLVKCDQETTTQNDINLGIVNIVVGFAPLKPAEFVIIKIQQLAGQINT